MRAQRPGQNPGPSRPDPVSAEKRVTEKDSTHEIVWDLHARFDEMGTRLTELRQDHNNLVERVSLLDGRLALIERVSSIYETANKEAHLLLSATVEKLNTRFGAMAVGIFMTLLAALGGLAVLLYQTLVVFARAGG
jgi:hypothetical protein